MPNLRPVHLTVVVESTEHLADLLTQVRGQLELTSAVTRVVTVEERKELPRVPIFPDAPKGRAHDAAPARHEVAEHKVQHSSKKGSK